MAINILQPEIFNRISAGEVVEKPASVIKELIENAIDAKATSINISICGGGIEQIRVSDNGCGIAKEDITKAFLPHATSKIKDIQDLDKILTLGFRGEALASIASVSQVQLISKTENEEIGSCIYINGGVIDRVEDKGCPTGTQITVNNLFFNTPARYKFLKKPRQEEAEITNLISRFILANPQIGFTYKADGKIIYQSTKGDLKQAIYVVYGKECYDSLKDIKYISSELKIKGYIGKPNFVKPNRTYQTLMVNGRYVNNQTVSTAVYNAFSGYLMTSKFPFFVINIEVPYDKVDVNVHPNKMEVKFQDSNAIFKAVYVAVKNALNEVETVVNIKNEDRSEKFVNSPIEIPKLQSQEGVSFNSNNIEKILEEKKERFDKIQASYNNITSVPSNNSPDLKIESNSSLFNKIMDKERKEIYPEIYETEEYLNFTYEKSLQENIDDFYKNKVLDDLSYKIIGKVFNTYIIIEKDDDCFIIDQHAGHERILFDKLYEDTLKGKVVVQQLLIPKLINVNHIEREFLLNQQEKLINLGFEIEEFGTNTFKVSAVPQLLCDINVTEFFNELLQDLNSFKNLTNAEIVRDKLATKACKSAVKAGDDLNESEIKSIINNMLKQTTPYLCPHGRPIIIKITKNEFEKMFKRIV